MVCERLRVEDGMKKGTILVNKRSEFLSIRFSSLTGAHYPEALRKGNSSSNQEVVKFYCGALGVQADGAL